MVVLETSLKRIQNLIGKKINAKEIESVLFDLGMELESFEDDELKIDITHDRTDLLSPQGLARSLRYYLGLQKGLPKYKIVESDIVFNVKKSVSEVRPFAVACIVKNLKFTDEFIKEIIWVQEKLHSTIGRNRVKAAIGIYPLEKITPPMTYSAEKPSEIRFVPLGGTSGLFLGFTSQTKFVPLGADIEMDGNGILKDHPTGKKYASLLEGKKLYPVLKDSEGKILSMPPIINSKLTGKVSEETKDIFMEVTGTHLKTIMEVLTILATIFAEEGGTIHVLKTKYEGGKTFRTPNLTPVEKTLNCDNVRKLIGIDFKDAEIKTLLERMGYEIQKSKNNMLTVLAPSYRTDLWHEVDLIDDIARAYGFNNAGFNYDIPYTTGDLLERTHFVNSLRDLMTSLSFTESFTFALTTEEEQYKKMLISEQERVEVSNEAKSNVTMVRTWIVPELLKCLEQNLHKQYPINLFEVSDVVLLDEKRDIKSRNETHLSGIMCSSDSDFTKMKSVLDTVMRALEIDYKVKRSNHKSFIPGRVADIIVNEEVVGVLGELKPEVIKNFGAELPVTALELNIEKFLKIN